MAGRPGKKAAQQPKPFDEFADEAETFDDDAPNVDPKSALPPGTRRDWRDVEKFREERELRKLIGEDFDDPFAERPTRRPGN